MPIVLILVVGLVYFGNVERQSSEIQEKENFEVTATSVPKIKSAIKNKTNTPKKLEPLKEVKAEPKAVEPVKVEPKAVEPVKEVKVEPKEIEPVKEVKVEPKKIEPVKEVKVIEPEKNYLKLILYTIAGILTIFAGAYIFSNRRNNQLTSNLTDDTRRDIEEETQPEPQVDQPVEEETQPEPAEQKPTEDDNNKKN